MSKRKTRHDAISLTFDMDDSPGYQARDEYTFEARWWINWLVNKLAEL